MNRRTLMQLAVVAAGGALARPALAQSAWPNQSIRLVVPFAAGGPTDVPARFFAEELGKILPQRVVVENRTGAGVIVGTEAVAKAPKDGYTFLYNTIAHSVLRPLFPRLNFDPTGDFQPVALLGLIPLMLLVPKELPAQTLPELVKLYRDNPGKYDYGSSGNGGAVHLATELFLARAGGLRVNHIPYRGSAPAMPDMLSGRLSMFLDVAATALGYHQRGELRALGISSAERIPQAPDVPTFAEGGVANAESYTWHMVLAPSGTPPEIVQAMNAALNRVAAMEHVQRRLSDLTMTLNSTSTPASATKFLQDEEAKWSAIIRDARITVN